MKLGMKQWGLLLLFAGMMLVNLLLPGMHAPPNAPATHGELQHVDTASAVDSFTSPGGIVYGRDLSGRFGSRIEHIMAHTRPDPSKPKHSIFLVKDRDGLVALIDEAWKQRGAPDAEKSGRGREVYDVDMHRAIGSEGERHLILVMEDENHIVTAYPSFR